MIEPMEPGAEFGGYRIEGLIAGGGMGQVYAARHAVYGSPVALKVLHADLGNESAWRKRFSEEGLVGLQLKHPHVVSARELVEQDGQLALVLDLVSGGMTLHRCISRSHQQGLQLEHALQLLLGIIQGVEYAHDRSVVHGDIKPENVLVEGDVSDPSQWVARVTDFGTVGLMAHPVMIEGQSAVVVSPRYASPEHMQGVAAIEAASDIYCLGLLLHYLLTGRHASTARTVNDAAEVVARPMSVVGLVDQPDSVIALFQRCTMLDPEERYTSCRELALAVRDVLEGLGVGLELEDLQADLATEVIEERQQMKAEAEARHAAAHRDPFDDEEDDLEDDLVLRSESEPGLEDVSVAVAEETAAIPEEPLQPEASHNVEPSPDKPAGPDEALASAAPGATPAPAVPDAEAVGAIPVPKPASDHVEAAPAVPPAAWVAAALAIGAGLLWALLG